jgi:hypothetical protein
MPGPRMLLRIAPLVVGLVAVRVWLRRREEGGRALAAAPEVPQIGAAATPGASPAGTAPAPEEPETAPPGRFQRQPIDIVTVVDDLLLGGR